MNIYRRSFDRGCKPAKHLQLIAESQALQQSFNNNCDLLRSIQLCHRRWKTRLRQRGQDDATGSHNVIMYLSNNSDFVIKTFNVFDDYVESLPHVIFIGRVENLSKSIVYGGQVVGLDATFNITCYKTYALYAIMGRGGGGAYPLGYFVSSSKNELAVREGLQLFKCAATEVLVSRQLMEPENTFSPLAICIDTDDAENLAVRRVFPNSIIILCHYHFMTSMINE